MNFLLLLLSISQLLSSRLSFSPLVHDPPKALLTGEIRLIRLRPGSSRSNVVCDSTTTTLSSKPAYGALSYVWGSPENPAYIFLDGRWITVSRNLEQALRGLWDKRQARKLWIDALSIDQNNAHEKNSQVQQMAFIYQRAQNVHVWLEPYAGKYSTYKMLAQEYWNRAWLVQEIGMALTVVVHYGRSVFEWAEFVRLAKECFRCMQRPPQIEQVAKLDRLRKSRYSHRQPYHLGELLQTTQDSFCAEPRDKIYAFLGMASDHSGSNIPVDYHKSLFEVY